MKHAMIAALILLAAAPAMAQQQRLPQLKPFKGTLDLTNAVVSQGFDSERFLIACWLASFYDLEKWSQRGINVAWSNQWTNPREKSLEEFAAKADACGIKVWRYPGRFMEKAKDDNFDRNDRSLQFYSLIDEPVLHKLDADAMKEQARAFRECNPKMKLVLNLEGDKFVQPTPPEQVVQQHTGYMEACDIGFVDWYVKNRNADRYPLSHLWTAVERLIVWGKTKPVGAFIECSNQHIAEMGREPTPGEMRAQIIGSIIHGARLIAYFPEVPGRKQNKGKQFGNGNDGTPPELEKEMVQINQQLQQLAPILLAPGARLTTVKDPLIAAVRWYKGNQYLIVLNNDDEESITVNGEKLGPYEWRVYTAGPAPKK